MKYRALNGREYHLNVQDYRVDWERKVSGPQKAVKDFLRPYWDRVGIIVTEETPVTVRAGQRALRIDLINWTRHMVVEISPQSSHSYNKFFHRGRIGFSASVKRDIQKEEWAVLNGFVYCEIGDSDMDCLSLAWWEDTFGVAL